MFFALFFVTCRFWAVFGGFLPFYTSFTHLASHTASLFHPNRGIFLLFSTLFRSFFLIFPLISFFIFFSPTRRICRDTPADV